MILRQATYLHQQRDELLKQRNGLHGLLGRPNMSRDHFSATCKAPLLLNPLNDSLPWLILNQTRSSGRPVQCGIVKHKDNAVRCSMNICHKHLAITFL